MSTKTARLGYCLPCGEERRDTDAVEMVDGDPMCAAHARTARQAPADDPRPKIEVPLCTRGCNQPRHRGNCPGQRNGGLQKGTTLRALEKQTGRNDFGQVAARMAEAGIGSPQSEADIENLIPTPITITSTRRGGASATMSLVRMEDLPSVFRIRKPNGRLGSIWEQLLTAPEDAPVVKIETSTVKLAQSLISGLLGKSKREGRKIERKRDGLTVYVWLV